MYKHILINTPAQICRNKLHDEIGLLDIDYSFTHDNSKITLLFKTINQYTSTSEEGEPVVTYTKDNYVDVKDDEGNVIGKKNEPIDFTNEMNDIIAEIDNRVANHNPTPIEPPLTKEQQLQNDLLAQKEMSEVTMSMLYDRILKLEGGVV